MPMININYGQNKELLKACRPLSEYAWIVEQIRVNRIDMDIESAVDKAINDMPKDYEIKEFLIGHRAEVKDLCITEYNEAETMKQFREEGREEGEGRLGSLISILIAKGRTRDVERAAKDKDARIALYKEFDIT